MGRRELEAHVQDRTQRTSGTLLPLLGKGIACVAGVGGEPGRVLETMKDVGCSQAGGMNIEQGVPMLRLALWALRAGVCSRE